MDNIIKLITEIFKDGNKKTILIITAIIGFYNLKTKAPEIYNELGKTLTECVDVSLQHIIAIIVTIILLYIITKILIYSDKKFYEELDRRYPESKKYESKAKKPISVVVYEKYQRYTKDKNYTREIVLQNGIGKDISYIKGAIEFYNNNVRFKIVPFEIHKLHRSRSHRIIFENIKDDEAFWNEFKIEIAMIVYDKTMEKNITLEGALFYRIPPDIKLKSKFEYIIPFNLEWLKDQFATKLIPRIKWYFKITKVYRSVPYEESLIEKIKYVRILFPMVVTLIIFGLTTCYLLDLAEFLYSFIKIWVRFILSLFS